MKRHTKFLIINIFISVVILTACGEKEKHIPGNLQFYETYFTSEISNQWNQAIIVSESEEVKNQDVSSDNNSDTSEMGLPWEKANTQKGLSDYVKFAGDNVLGFVSPEDKNTVDEILKRKDILSLFPEDIKFMWCANLEKLNNNSKEMFIPRYACKIPESGKADVNGSHIETNGARVIQENGKNIVQLKMTPEGSYAWGKMTTKNVKRTIAITIDNVVYSAATVINPITSGDTQISGVFTWEEANELCERLNSFSSNKKL